MPIAQVLNFGHSYLNNPRTNKNSRQNRLLWYIIIT
jgi:hypothetical protein